MTAATDLDQGQGVLLLRKAPSHAGARPEAEGHEDEGVDVGVCGLAAPQPALGQEALGLLDVLRGLSGPVVVQTQHHLNTQCVDTPLYILMELFFIIFFLSIKPIKSIFIIHQYAKHKHENSSLTHGLKTQKGTFKITTK